MKISELVEVLQKIKESQGDSEVYMQIYDSGNSQNNYIHLGKLKEVYLARAGGVYLTGSD